VYNIREAVNQALEISRKAGVIGSSLAADVVLYVDDAIQTILQPLGDELRFVLITSGAQLLPLDDAPKEALASDIPGLTVLIKASNAEKCVRCWHRASDIGKNEAHPELCQRCVTNVSGNGEIRTFA
jgi:isoleucyl-tRNA synthetase